MKSGVGPVEERETARVFLATAHPAKFREVVEPVIGRKLEVPSSLAVALAAPRRVLPIAPTNAAVRRVVAAG
jgi:threonine synthase